MRTIEEQFTQADNNELMKEYNVLYAEFERLEGYKNLWEKDKFISVFDINAFLDKKYRELSGGEKQYIR
jgi:ABC-type molybdate transport system ATPase subunit